MGKWLLAFCLAMFFFLAGLPYLVVQVRAPVSAELKRTPTSLMPVHVYLPGEKRLLELALEEYIKGVVAAEMPADFHEEALRAQAIVARTYLIAHMPAFGGQGCGVTQIEENDLLLPGSQTADICADPRQGQAWLSTAELRQRWGVLGYVRYWQKVSHAVDSTRGKIIVYRDMPIDAVYHAASGGRTEAALHVWGNEVPYLQSVASPWEEGTRYWRSSQQFDLVELAAKLNVPADDLLDQIRQGEEPLAIIRHSPSGRALEVRVGQRTFTGKEFREKMNLSSNWIEIRLEGRRAEIITRGYGHGAGMSQYGADALARRGKTAEEIIRHYYPGVELREIFAE